MLWRRNFLKNMARRNWAKSPRCIFGRRCARRVCRNRNAKNGGVHRRRAAIMKISVIIPALNEARELPETIRRAAGAFEIILADGGSDDGTADTKGAIVVRAPRGRALQMNAGAAMARGDVFLFLHADTWLESGAFDAIESAMVNERIVGGGFERRFRTESFFLRATCAMAALRNHAIGWHLGDQAIFCRA